MESIKLGRVVAGGLLAGLILNFGEAALHAGVLAEATQEAFQALGRSEPGGAGYLVLLVLVTFLQGIVAVGLYAAVRPRLGAGAATAAGIGLVMWILSALYSGIYLHSGFAGIFPGSVVWIPVAWGLVEYPLAVWAGARVYKE